MTQEEFHKRYQYSPTKDSLGEGGFGKVFKAYDTHLDKWVAIKMAEVKPGLEHVRLKHEVEIVNKLPTHPNIARYEECYTFSSFTGEYDFAVLQYYEYGNLQQLLESKQLTEQQKDSILHQILTGIEFLHNEGIIHRDLKPQNILIVNRNGEYIPKITDFGISKKLDANKSSVFTNSLAGVGTLAYASPEQLSGQTIKKNTDLWSFGVIVCYVFLGKLPFDLGNVSITSEAGRIELYKQITNGNLDNSVNQLPTQWYNVVKKCLVVDILERIENADKCLNLLNNVSTVVATTLNKSQQTQLQNLGNVSTDIIEKKTENINTKNSFSESDKSKHKKSIHFAIYLVSICLILFLFLYFGIENGLWYKGNEVIPLKYENAGGFSEGLAPVKLNGKWGYIDKQGNEVIERRYDGAGSFSEDLAPVELNGKWGFIDKQGIIVIPFIYDIASFFSEGLAIVNIGGYIDGKSGFIDKQGRVVIAFNYNYVCTRPFKEGLAAVKEDIAI